MERNSINFWIRISLLNLLIVASFGILMRYKIGFEFPYFDQKNLQHAHSHFAFYGWISQTLMLLLVLFLAPFLSIERQKRYKLLLILNLLFSYIMLISFAAEGYGIISIVISTLSFLNAVVFSLTCNQDLKKIELNHPSFLWFKASLFLNIISSIGTFVLAYMMATKNINQHVYLASVYWYLHFQYNGWFFFACMGLFLGFIKTKIPSIQISNSIFWIFFISSIPAYGLSTLWAEIPIFIYVIIVLSAIAQFYGWIKLVRILKRISFLKNTGIDALSKFLFITVGLAFTIKISLQLMSTIPTISKLAFGFRPIVIAYLHLVLLAVISVFLLTYFYANKILIINKGSVFALVLFVLGIFLNELVLALQGIASFDYHIVPYTNELLFAISLFMFAGLLILFLSQFFSSKSN